MDNPGKKIFLIGFMGSGKSTVGKKLAFGLGWSFLDLDTEIEKKEGLNISEIFSKRGEAYFRHAESEMLRTVSEKENIVISTGGGTPCLDDNMDFMIKSGLTIYLKLSHRQLYGRLVRASAKRPLLKNIPKRDLPDYIAIKLTEREKWYNQSAIVFEKSGSNISELLMLVKNRIKE
jgi:shikimate kinase